MFTHKELLMDMAWMCDRALRAGVVGVIVAAAGLAVGLAVPSFSLAQLAETAKASATSRASVATLMKIRSPGSPTLAADGSLYVRDWPDGVWQLYKINAADVGKKFSDVKPAKLTEYKDGLASYSLSPDGSKIILAYAAGGNENTQISILETATGTVTPILTNLKVQYQPSHWLKDGSGFLYSANDASPADFYLYRYDFLPGRAMGASTKLLGREGSWSSHDVSADGSRVLVSRDISASQSEIFEMRLAANDEEPTLNDLSVRDKTGTLTSAEIVGYMPGDAAVVLRCDVEEGISRLFVRDLASGKMTKPVAALDKFELDGAGMNNEKTLLTVAANEDGYGVPYVFRLPGFETVEVPAMERGVVNVADLRGNRVVWSVSNARKPGVSFAYDVPAATAKADAKGDAKAGADVKKSALRQITLAEDQGVDLNSFPLPELVKYSSFDGVEIPAFVWMPPGAKAGTPISFVVNYHGGPEGQWRPGFSPTTQVLLSRGFGVMQPNVRGSTGYGRAFQMMDDYKNRWASVKDGVEAARWLVKNNYAKSGKIAAYGGSYGGFMAVAVIVEDGEASEKGTPRVFGSSINVVGIVNMKTFLEQTSGYRRKLREVEYGPLTDPDFLATVSPIHKIDKIKVPMMIAHGLNDPRVPVGEAMQLAVALQKRGDDPELLFCPDEGHGFQKLENRLLFTERMVKFLERTVGR